MNAPWQFVRCDLFARQTHNGFEPWGDQASKFDEAVSC